MLAQNEKQNGKLLKKTRWHSSSSDSTVFGLATSWKKLIADSLVFYTNVDNIMKYYINPAPAD